MTHWIAGIDLGATKIAMGLVTPDGRIVARQRLSTHAAQGPESAAERIAAVIEAWRSAFPHGAITACGVCTPGPVDHASGLILDPPNLGWHNVPFRDMLAGHLNLPVTLEHDAKAAALGEFYFGKGRELNARDLVYVIVGTGIGAAIILDGRLYRGRTNASGEIGHITIERHGPPGSSGIPGCVEAFAGGPAIEAHYARLTGQHLSGEAIAQRASAGDEAALQVMADAGDALGAAVATTAMLMDVDLFVIGGSVSRAGDLLLEPARRAVWKYAFRSVASRVRIVATALHEDGAILGCAWQAERESRHED